MRPSTFTPVLTRRDFLESPRWHEGRLWVSDFYRHEVLAVHGDGEVEVVAGVERQPSGLGCLPDGRALIVSMLDRRVLRLEPDGSLVMNADLADVATGPCNDMVVDANGRAYVGNFGFDLMKDAPLADAALALVEPNGRVRVAADGLTFPNGCAIVPGGRTPLVTETFGNRVSSFDIHPEGTLGERRAWATFGSPPTSRDMAVVHRQLAVAPDGIALDDHGCLWIADADGHRLLRVAEGGRILSEVSTGDMRVFACALGGPERRTLYACVSPESDAALCRGAGAAAVWAMQVEVRGAGRP